MGKLPPPPPPRRVPFFQREDWLISAGLALVLYFLTLIMVYYYIPGSHILRYLVHLLVPLAIGMGWMGLKQRDEILSRARASRAKRRHAEAQLNKQGAEAKKQAVAGPEGEEKKK